MVRRRLNKKVAFFGSALFIILALVIILVMLQFNRGPAEFIKDAESALQTARQSTDQKTKDQYYDIAIKKYGSAYSKVVTNEERKEILIAMVDLFIEIQNWPYALDCWDKILIIEPDNIKAQYSRLRYLEVLGDSGVPTVWKQINEYATPFLKITQEKDLMSYELSNLKIPTLDNEGNITQKLGTYLFLVRGKSALEQVNLGTVTNPEDMLEMAKADFEKAKELESDNIDVYLELAKTNLSQGELSAVKGSIDGREKAQKEALAILEQAVNNASDKIKARINLINYQVVIAREGELEEVQSKLKSFESDYMSLADEYKRDSSVYESLSQFYAIYSQYTKLDTSKEYLDKAIEAISKGMEIDEQNVILALQVTDLLYRRYSIYTNEPDLVKAVEIAEKALSWPDAQNTKGPRNNVRTRNRFLLNSFLADSYIEQVLSPESPISDSDKTALISKAEEAVHEIEMIIRTDEDPTIIKWQGMLELAKGNKQEAVIKLNKAYEQFKSVKPSDPPWPLDIDFAKLSYTLAKVFMDTEELGKVHEYLLNAHYSGITEIKPEARLDYVETILKFNRFTDALDNIDAFEEDYGRNTRSQKLRVETYIYSSKYDEAENELNKMPSSDPETILLQLTLAESKIRQVQMKLAQSTVQNQDEQNDIKSNREIKEYLQAALGSAEKLLDTKPDLLKQSSIANLCGICVNIDEISKASELVSKYLAKFPDNLGIKVYKQVLSEPEPAKITQKRYSEIEEQTIKGLSDPIKRALNLGILFTRNNDLSKAIEQYNVVLEAAKSPEFSQNSSEYENVKLAARNMFEISLSTKQYDMTENIIKIAREKNLDGFHGYFYEARFAIAKNNYENALTKTNECLKERPVSSQVYLLRGNINAALGNEYAYLEDISKAAYINPLDGTIAKNYAIALYDINRDMKNEVTSVQFNNTRSVLEKAIALNQGDFELLGIYTDFISQAEPKQAIAIRQDILAAVPSLENAIRLGTLALDVADNTSVPQDKEAFLDIAGSAFEQAMKIDPNDRDVLLFYTNYLRERGRGEEAEQLLESSKDSILLANDLFQKGDYEKAREILEKLYVDDSNNAEILRGLMVIAQNTGDKEAVKEYSQKLISIDNNRTHLLLQIKAYITVGLYNEAEYKLQSFKERYPDEKEVSILQAWLYYKQGNAKKALDVINTYVQGNKNNPNAWQLRSDINIALNEYQRAISDLKTCKSLTDDPSIGIAIAKVYIKISNYEDAEKELKEILDKPNPPMEANLLLESIYQKLGRKTALENLYNNIIDKNPDNVPWLNKAAEYAVQIQEFERAQTLYKKSCDIIGKSYAGDKQGEEIEDNQYVNAFDGYLKALLKGTGDISQAGSHPEYSETVLKEAARYTQSSYASIAYLRMAQASSLLEREQDVQKYSRLAMEKVVANEKYAIKTIQEIYPVLRFEGISNYCTRMLEKNPNSQVANYAMHYILKANGNYIESVKYINKCIDLVDKNNPIRSEYILQKDEALLNEYKKTSDNQYINQAINDYESLLSEMPNNIQVLNNLAYILAESGQKLSDALEYSERVQELQPNNPGFLDTYAFVLLKNEKYIDAEKTIEKAFSEYSEQGNMTIPADVYEHKGMIKEKLGNNQEALAAYKKAMELGSSHFSQKTMDRLNQAIERVSP